MLGVQREMSVESVGGSVEDEGEGEEGATEKEGEISTRKPALLALPDDQTVMQIDCGTFHTGTGSIHSIGNVQVHTRELPKKPCYCV